MPIQVFMSGETLQQSGRHAAKTPVDCQERGYEVTLPELQHKQRALSPRCGFNLSTYRSDTSLGISSIQKKI